jgi:hypothetical protein
MGPTYPSMVDHPSPRFEALQQLFRRRPLRSDELETVQTVHWCN